MNQPKPDIDPRPVPEIVPQPEPPQPQPVEPFPGQPQELPDTPQPVEDPTPGQPAPMPAPAVTNRRREPDMAKDRKDDRNRTAPPEPVPPMPVGLPTSDAERPHTSPLRQGEKERVDPNLSPEPGNDPNP